MLNVFPIQFLALFAYFILRVFVGSVLLYLGLLHFSTRHTLKEVLTLSWWPFGLCSTLVLSLTEIILAVMITFGVLTQIAVLVLALLCLKMIILRERFNHETIPPRLVYVLLLGAALCLFITGAGAFAFDLPL
jgi:uncharacterized membrane protein YphA (DoxX/SURF4 family)